MVRFKHGRLHIYIKIYRNSNDGRACAQERGLFKQQHRLETRKTTTNTVSSGTKCWESMERARNENIVNEPATALQTANAEPGETPTTVLKEDLVVLAQWVKTDLFEKVKFLYNPEKELQVNGRLYKLFVNNCKGRLAGLKGTLAVGEYRRIYVELLWQEANKKKQNLVTNGLTIRRSSIYSSMQNRFVGKLASG